MYASNEQNVKNSTEINILNKSSIGRYRYRLGTGTQLNKQLSTQSIIAN
jgi:hypothetical protein